MPLQFMCGSSRIQFGRTLRENTYKIDMCLCDRRHVAVDGKAKSTGGG